MLSRLFTRNKLSQLNILGRNACLWKP